MTRSQVLQLLNENKDYGGYLNEEQFVDALFELAREEQRVTIYVEPEDE